MIETKSLSYKLSDFCKAIYKDQYQIQIILKQARNFLQSYKHAKLLLSNPCWYLLIGCSISEEKKQFAKQLMKAIFVHKFENMAR